MNSKTTTVLSIATVIAGAALNFPEFLMGSPANAKNIIVTLAYIAMGILVLSISAINKNQRIMAASVVFWLLTFLFALLTAYVNATGAIVDWAIPFVIVLLGPWYGVSFFISDFVAVSIIIALISFGMLATAIWLLQHIKYN